MTVSWDFIRMNLWLIPNSVINICMVSIKIVWLDFKKSSAEYLLSDFLDKRDIKPKTSV